MTSEVLAGLAVRHVCSGEEEQCTPSRRPLPQCLHAFLYAGIAPSTSGSADFSWKFLGYDAQKKARHDYRQCTGHRKG
jgi:hypothetical protein